MHLLRRLTEAGAAALCILGASDALAIGTLTGIGTSNQTIATGDSVPYTVKGTGHCDFLVSLIDSASQSVDSIAYAHPNGMLPKQASFAPKPSGHYKLTVAPWGVGDPCSGGLLTSTDIHIVAAGGSVTGITPTTQSINPGSANFSVSGTGLCSFAVALKDGNGLAAGNPLTVLNNSTWPRVVSTSVSNPGDYTVAVGNAGGPSGCTGTPPTAALHVNKPFKPPVLPGSPPIITSGPKELFPDSFFFVGGSNFGPAAGSLKVIFKEKTVSVPIGSPPSDWWYSGATAGSLPNVESVSDQNVTIALTTKDGTTATWQAHFNPRMEIKAMSLGDNHVKLKSCSTDGVANFCFSGSGTLSDPGDCAHFGATLPLGGLVSLGNNAFVGQHHGCWGLNIDAGFDVYTLSLQNGWKINTFDLASQTDNGAVTLLGGTKFIGLSTAAYSIQWSIGKNGGGASYVATITIKGPKGLAF